MGNPMDSDFEMFAKQAEADLRARNSKKSSGFTYEEIFWTGLELNVPKIIRAVGGVPDSNADKSTAITRRIAWITGDNGKKFRVIFPERDENPDHLLWRVIASVNETTYINKKKVFIHENRNPDIFSMVNKNGLDSSSSRAIFDSGWIGKTKFLMNCIDREKMDWHRQHKHTLLLSKNVNVEGDKVYAEEGVPAYGFSNLLTTGIFKFYKDWRKYDIAITRLGLKETPFRIINASKYIEEIPEKLQPLVSNAPWLTEEEESWETYDLQKLFKYTSMTKIYNNLKLSLEKIDKRLGTRYKKLFEEAVEKEQEERETAKNSLETELEETPIVETVKVSVQSEIEPKTRVKTRVEETVYSNVFGLNGWDSLTQQEKEKILDVERDSSGKVKSIKYSTNEELLACPDCKIASPESFTHCPNCGKNFLESSSS